MPLPLRAARLAAWGTAYLRGDVDVERAVRAVEGEDEPHLVVTEPLHEPEELADALVNLRGQDVAGLRPALPVPGDLLGLTGPAEVNRAALEAGEAVVAVLAGGGPQVPVWVPEVTSFGPDGDRGHCVTWRGMAGSAAWPDVPTLGEADRDLRSVMQEVIETLRRLDAAPWGPDGRRTAEALRGQEHALHLPDACGARADTLSRQALAVLALAETARDDDGGTVSAHAAESRRTALAPLTRAARRALVAACSAALEPARR
jgi:hypothetical protein